MNTACVVLTIKGSRDTQALLAGKRIGKIEWYAVSSNGNTVLELALAPVLVLALALAFPLLR